MNHSHGSRNGSRFAGTNGDSSWNGDNEQNGFGRNDGTSNEGADHVTRGNVGAYPGDDSAGRWQDTTPRTNAGSGYPEQRGRQFDSQGWGESNANVGRAGNGNRSQGAQQGNRSYGRDRQPTMPHDHRDFNRYYRDDSPAGYAEREFGGQGSYDGDFGANSQGADGHDGSQQVRQPWPVDQANRSGTKREQGNSFGSGNPNDSAHAYSGRGYAQHGSSGQGYGQGSGQRFSHSEYGQSAGSGYGQPNSSFRGVGPKGYKRSNERLQEDISEQLMHDHHIDASEVTIKCVDGVVTLEGSVSHRQLKYRIEDLVEQTQGVTDVDNRLSVKRAERQSDGSIDSRMPAKGVAQTGHPSTGATASGDDGAKKKS